MVAPFLIWSVEVPIGFVMIEGQAVGANVFGKESEKHITTQTPSCCPKGNTCRDFKKSFNASIFVALNDFS